MLANKDSGAKRRSGKRGFVGVWRGLVKKVFGVLEFFLCFYWFCVVFCLVFSGFCCGFDSGFYGGVCFFLVFERGYAQPPCQVFFCLDVLLTLPLPALEPIRQLKLVHSQESPAAAGAFAVPAPAPGAFCFCFSFRVAVPTVRSKRSRTGFCYRLRLARDVRC